MRLNTIHIIWLRELKRYVRNRSRIIGSLGMPFFFLVILGTGVSPMLEMSGNDLNYKEYIMPGVIGMVLLFSSVFTGISVIWDRQFGFLKEMLVAPISRTAIVLGKTIGGTTTSMIQAVLMLMLSLLVGVKVHSFSGFLLSLVFMALISASFVAIGVAFASNMTDMHGFQLIMNFLIMPIFFLSGALFPLEGLPVWMRVLSYLDPLTYGVDALRYCLLGAGNIPIFVNLIVLTGFALVTVSIGAFMFRRTTL